MTLFKWKAFIPNNSIEYVVVLHASLCPFCNCNSPQNPRRLPRVSIPVAEHIEPLRSKRTRKTHLNRSTHCQTRRKSRVLERDEHGSYCFRVSTSVYHCTTVFNYSPRFSLALSFLFSSHTFLLRSCQFFASLVASSRKKRHAFIGNFVKTQRKPSGRDTFSYYEKSVWRRQNTTQKKRSCERVKERERAGGKWRQSTLFRSRSFFVQKSKKISFNISRYFQIEIIR